MKTKILLILLSVIPLTSWADKLISKSEVEKRFLKMVEQSMPSECVGINCIMSVPEYILRKDSVEVGLPENPLTLLNKLSPNTDVYEVSAVFDGTWGWSDLGMIYNATLLVTHTVDAKSIHHYRINVQEYSFKNQYTQKELDFKAYRWATNKPYY